jgi:TRAP-type C4-dicarboxylate transport system permease small subunit
MALLLGLLAPLQLFNDTVLRVGRWVAVVALGAMVIVILTQVFFRYVLNNALPWPDEAARFAMLWMTGVVAPSAYRRGGFVAIDMLEQALPPRPGAVLALILLLISLVVLMMGIQLGWNHVNSGWLFNSSSLKIPLDLVGGEVVRIKLAWMFLSLFVGVVLLTLVNIELILRSLVTLLGGEDRLKPLATVDIPEAE